MTTIRRWFRRSRSQSGATVPEYALLLGAFAVLSFGAINQLRDESDAEMTETSECIGKLPSEPGCGLGVEEVPPDPGDPGSDPDGDTIPNSDDNCPTTFNSDQADTDGDGQGNECDPTPNGDDDTDGVDNLDDNCRFIANPPDPDTGEQLDTDADGPGDPCDNCPTAANTTQTDTDSDGKGNVCDNCPNTSNPSQADSDGDGVGDACDPSSSHVDMGGGSSVANGGTPVRWTARVNFVGRNNLGTPIGGTVSYRWRRETCPNSGATGCSFSATWTNGTATIPAGGTLTNFVINNSLNCGSPYPRVNRVEIDLLSFAGGGLPWDNVDSANVIITKPSSSCSTS